MRFLPVSYVSALVLAGVTACFPIKPDAPRRAGRDPRLITREDIARSGASDAWEALRRSGSFVATGEGKRTGGGVAASQRGRSSFLLSNQMLLVIDDVLMSDLNALRDIRAEQIFSIRILSSAEGSALYGTFGGSGAIVVRTANGIPDP